MGTFGGALGRPSGTFGRCPGFPGGLGVLWRSLASPGEPQVPPGDPMRFQGVPGDPMIENRTGSLAFWGDKGRTLLKNIGFLKVLKGTTGLSRGPLEGPRGSSGASRRDHESATGFPREIHDNLLDLDMQFTAFA